MISKRITAAILLSSSLAFGSAQAMSVDGLAVATPGGTSQVGLNGSGSLADWIKYYIPLDGNNNGTYGTGAPCDNGAGTCSDRGYGSQTHYDNADALFMNIYFDMTGKGHSSSASLSFEFDDLDLTPGNDPYMFYESISLAYWDTDSNSFVDLSGTIKDATPPAPAGSPEQQLADENLVFWDLNLAAIDALNASVESNDGFWIQLGFGSLYDISPCNYYRTSLGSTHYASYSADSYGGGGGGAGGSWDCRPRNTPEYLTAELTTVSKVPLPASVWLFGTALIGFIGIARRTGVS